jgi:hypothetical protein
MLKLMMNLLLVAILFVAVSASRTRTLRNAATRQSSLIFKNLFDEWADAQHATAVEAEKMRKEAKGSKDTAFMEVRADGNVKEGIATGVKETFKKVGKNPLLSKLFADCNKQCIERNLNRYCVFPSDGEPNDVTEIATRFAEIAVDQSDEGGFVTAFHSVVCGFAIKGKLLFIFLKRTIESCFDRNIEASPAPIVCFFLFPPSNIFSLNIFSLNIDH